MHLYTTFGMASQVAALEHISTVSNDSLPFQIEAKPEYVTTRGFETIQNRKTSSCLYFPTLKGTFLEAHLNNGLP